MRFLPSFLVALSLASLPSAQTWTALFDGDTNGGASLGVGPDGITVVHRRATNGAQITIDPHGDTAHAYINTPVSRAIRWCKVFPEPDGTNVYVGNGTDDQPWMIALQGAAGETQWTLSGSNVATPLNDACRTSDGRYVAVGTRTNQFGVDVPFLWSTASNFTSGWRKLHGDGSNSEKGLAVAPLANGAVAMVSSTSSQLRLTYIAVDGDVMFRQHLSTTYTLSQPHLAATDDDGVILAGLADGHFFTARYDRFGGRVWAIRYITEAGDPFFASTPEVGGITQTLDGGFALAVTQPRGGGSNQDDAAILRLSDVGTPQYLRAFGTPSDERAEDIAVTPEGGLVLAGTVENGTRIRIVRLDEKGKSAPSCAYFGHSFSNVYSIPLSASTTFPNVTDDPTPLFTLSSSTQPFPITPSVPCIDDCKVQGGTFGVGLAGTGGIEPQLVATDGACLGWTPELQVSQVVGGAVGFLAHSFSLAPVQIFGGLIYPNLAQVSLTAIQVDGAPGAAGAGRFTRPIPPSTNLTAMKGTVIYAQAAFFDPAAPGNVSMTPAATWSVQ